MGIQAKFECVLCPNLYTEEDILNFKYFIETRICYKCYKKMYRADESISCFAKQYDALAEECRLWCPDKRICTRFKKIVKLKKKAEESTNKPLVQIQQTTTTSKYPFRSGCIADKAFKLCLDRVEKDKLKRLCSRYGTSYYRIVRAFKKGERNGKSWRWKDDGKYVEIEYNV